MNQRIIVIASAFAAFVHCGGQATAGSGTEGPDASGASSGGSSGASSSGGSSGGGSSSGGSSGGGPDSGGDGACPRPADAAPRATTPPGQRAQATACAPSASHTFCGATDGGGQSCTTDTDCAQDGGTLYSHCLRGRCDLDQCLADSDCSSTQVCSCSSAYYGGNGCYHPNVCVPADCHVDSDCGPGGFCSPTAGYCGVVEGFYCHKASDACFDPAVDCACAGPGNGACVYAPTTGAWVCGSAICAG